jgi:hypothetical protein
LSTRDNASAINRPTANSNRPNRHVTPNVIGVRLVTSPTAAGKANNKAICNVIVIFILSALP